MKSPSIARKLIATIVISLVPVMASAFNGTIGLVASFEQQPVVSDGIALRYKVRVNNLVPTTNHFMIIFQTRRLYNPTCVSTPERPCQTYLIDSNLYTYWVDYEDQGCLPWPPSNAGPVQDGESSLWLAIPDYNFDALGGMIGSRPRDLITREMFPRVMTGVDGIPRLSKIETMSQMDITGKDITVEYTRGGTFVEPLDGWGYRFDLEANDGSCTPYLPDGVVYRIWTATVTIDNQVYTYDFAVPDAFASHLAPYEVFSIVTEFLERSPEEVAAGIGFWQAYFWDIEILSESTNEWSPIRRMRAHHFPDGQGDRPIGWGAKIGSYNGTPVLEISNDTTDTYIQLGDIIEIPETPEPEITIMEIQGAGHISPLVGETITTRGIVTALAYNGYYVQDAVGDGEENTSDGVFVYTGDAPSVTVGDEVELTAVPSEYIPGGAGSGNLSTTQLSFPKTTVLSSSNPLPVPVVIGTSGRVPPAVEVITKEERPVNLQKSPGVFNPDNDGIDFYESLEGMLVTVENPVAVSATHTYSSYSSELFTLTNDGDNIAPSDARTARGGINLQPDPDNDGDQNPERVQIQFGSTLYPSPVPEITVGDRLGNVTGVVGYSNGNFEINAVEELVRVSHSTIQPETTDLVGNHKMVTVASYDVLNLSPLVEDDNQRETIAAQIVNNLRSPDVIALQEIQDNSGETDDGITDAAQTLEALVGAIVAAGGPRYKFFDVAPEDRTSGDVPGGNIRNAFLYNPKRVKLVFYLSLTQSVLENLKVTKPDAFFGARNPLAATFMFKGRPFTVLNNHLTSRFGSTPIFGGLQPFLQAGEDEREEQCLALYEVVRKFKQFNKNARIIVLGNFNTFQWTNDLAEILPGTGADRILDNLIETIDDDNVYTYIFDGNSQVLDHALVTNNLLAGAKIDIVHVNVDFPRINDSVGSDHEPIVLRFNI